MTDSMTKYNHRMTAEESITNFITHLEETGSKVTQEQRDWIYQKGFEIFDSYYIDSTAQVNLATEDDRNKLTNYLGEIQECLGRMFAHIMILEFKLYLLTQG